MQGPENRSPRTQKLLVADDWACGGRYPQRRLEPFRETESRAGSREGRSAEGLSQGITGVWFKMPETIFTLDSVLQ